MVLRFASYDEERSLVTLGFQSCKLEFAVSQPGVTFGKRCSHHAALLRNSGKG